MLLLLLLMTLLLQLLLPCTCTCTCTCRQVDLTDDYVIMALFGDGAWEDRMTRLTARDDAGALVDVVLDSDAFRDLISVLE
jgi:hypothetical protein